MSGGLAALLDDIAMIARAAAASVDDVSAMAGRASAKAVGVVIDDAAVTPRYVTGFSPARELPMIWRIARGSLRNKLVFILPGLLLLSAFLPASITYLLMLGGLFLCYEGAEKVLEATGLVKHHHAEDTAEAGTPEEHEQNMVAGAIRTDFILSAEIMAIGLSDVAGEPILRQAMVLIVVGIFITALVYGVVAFIVKMDDIGLKMVESGKPGQAAIGRALVKGMPHVLNVLSVVGTAAMLWVGGHILSDGLHKMGVHGLHDLVHGAHEFGARLLPFMAGFSGWLFETLLSALVGLVAGLVVVGLLKLLPKKEHAH